MERDVSELANHIVRSHAVVVEARTEKRDRGEILVDGRIAEGNVGAHAFADQRDVFVVDFRLGLQPIDGYLDVEQHILIIATREIAWVDLNRALGGQLARALAMPPQVDRQGRNAVVLQERREIGPDSMVPKYGMEQENRRRVGLVGGVVRSNNPDIVSGVETHGSRRLREG